MSEKLYACVLHLFAPRFYRVYGEEATRLVRDLCRDEQGVARKIRLWVHLLADLALAAIRDHRLAVEYTPSQLAAADAIQPAPSFIAVGAGLPRAAALLVHGAFSLGILVTFSALIGHGVRGQTTSPPLLRAHLLGKPSSSARFSSGGFALADAAVNPEEKKRVLNGVISNLREYYVLSARSPGDDRRAPYSRKEGRLRK